MAPAQVLNAVEEDVLSALMNLGYQRATAEKALAWVGRNGGPFEKMFREALGALVEIICRWCQTHRANRPSTMNRYQDAFFIPALSVY